MAAGNPGKRPLAILAALVFLLHLAVTAGHLMSPDEELLFRMTESLATGGSLQIAPLEMDLATGKLPEGLAPEQCFATKVGREPGTFYAQYLPLQPLLAVPLYALGAATEPLFAGGFAKLTWPGMAMSYLDTLPPGEFAGAAWRRAVVVMLWNPLIAALTAVALVRLETLLTGCRRASLAAAALWAFATIAWPYSRTFFTEPFAGLLVLLAFDSFCRWRLFPAEANRHAVLAGAFLALANWTRVDSPFFTAGLVLAMSAIALWRRFAEESWARPDAVGRSLLAGLRGPVATGLIATGAWFALQGFNAFRFGGDLTSGYGDQSEGVKFTTPLAIGLHGLLFSPGKGLFFFSPALLLGAWGWWRARGERRWLFAAALAAWGPFFLAMAMWQNWDGGWCWGPRHIIQIGPGLMIGAALLLRGPWCIGRKAIVGAAGAIGVAVQLYGSSQSPLEMYHEYFRTFRDEHYARTNLRELQAMAMQPDFAFRVRERDGSDGAAIPFDRFPAPMIDTIYLPQHTAWYLYADMWRFGYCDVLLVNAIFGSRNPDRWSRE